MKLAPPVRCPTCSRILFLRKDNKLPPHRVPMIKVMPTRYNQRDGGSVPLTGKDSPWCAGGQD